jgi:hypothetical protein
VVYAVREVVMGHFYWPITNSETVCQQCFELSFFPEKKRKAEMPHLTLHGRDATFQYIRCIIPYETGLSGLISRYVAGKCAIFLIAEESFLLLKGQ